jgi:hypothetical protein
MGFEYSLRFSDHAWYSANRDRLADRIRALPSLREEKPRGDFKLKGDDAADSWSYDLRIILEPTGVLVIDSGASSAFRRDLREVLRWIRRETSVDLVDDDGSPLELP